MDNKKLILPIVIGLILVIFLILYFVFFKKQAAPNSTIGGPIRTLETSQSLGGEIYKKAQNPIGDKLPEANPAPNPIEGVYKNPFAE